MTDKATEMKERKVREAFATEEKKPVMNRDKGVERIEPGMVFLLENTSRRSHDRVPFLTFAQSLTT